MPSLDQVIDTVVERSQRGSMNESNTKVLLIEPVLEALGWSTTNLDSVTREFRVFDGTFLDYALQGDGRPRLFIEAKSWGSHLGDPKWIAQTVNYANNEGVVWCALSDGMVYRVYKTNEPVDMASKLVFEVDLRNYADSDQRQSVLRYLSSCREMPSSTGVSTRSARVCLTRPESARHWRSCSTMHRTASSP